MLRKIADILTTEPPEYSASLNKAMDSGLSYPAACEKALKEYHMPLFQIPYMVLGAWNWKPGKKVYFLNLQLDSEEFDRKFPAALKSIHRLLAERKMVDRSFIYLWMK